MYTVEPGLKLVIAIRESESLEEAFRLYKSTQTLIKNMKMSDEDRKNNEENLEGDYDDQIDANFNLGYEAAVNDILKII